MIKAEEKIIQEERAEQTAQEEDIKKKKLPAKEDLIDTAPILRDSASDSNLKKTETKKDEEEITTKDIETLEDALDALGKEKKKMIVEKEELNELKEELHDYEEVRD